MVSTDAEVPCCTWPVRSRQVDSISNYSIPKTAKDPVEQCSSGDVDVAFVLSSDDYYVDQAVLAPLHNKFVFTEQPLACKMERY
jgi:predicted dehydrogenase